MKTSPTENPNNPRDTDASASGFRSIDKEDNSLEDEEEKLVFHINEESVNNKDKVLEDIQTKLDALTRLNGNWSLSKKIVELLILINTIGNDFLTSIPFFPLIDRKCHGE